MEIIGITISESNQGHVIVYTDDGQEQEVTNSWFKENYGIKKYYQYLRD